MQRALEQIIQSEHAADRAIVPASPAVAGERGRRNDEQPVELGQRRRQLLGHAERGARITRIAADGGKRHDPDMRAAAGRARRDRFDDLFGGGRLAPGRAADFQRKPLRFYRRGRIEQVGQCGTAPVVGLDRHATFTAGSMGTHQCPPGTLMRAIDLQQTLGGDDSVFRGQFAEQQLLRDRAAPVAQPLSLGREPHVECRVQALQSLEQVAIEQRESRRVRRTGR